MRGISLILAVVILCVAAVPVTAAEDTATASTMQLMRYTGTTGVTNGSGREMTLREKMRLYNGYGVSTGAASYAWVNLDDTRLMKLDEVSEVEVRKSGKQLEMLLMSGNLYFDIATPLESGETLNIRTSTMAVGIRGTCGWVNIIDRWTSEIHVLEGTVEVYVTDPVTGEIKTAEIHGGESAIAVAYPYGESGIRCDIIQDRYGVGDIDAFVLVELLPDEALCGEIYEDSGLDVRQVTPEAAQEQLERDNRDMQELLDGIAEKQEKQDNNVKTGGVWGDGDASGSEPDTPGTGGGGGSRRPNPQDPQGPDITLMMPQTAAEVQRQLNRPDVDSVTLTPGRNADDNTLSIPGALEVPADKKLVLANGVNASVGDNGTLTVNGTMTGEGEDNRLMSSGTVEVNSANTLVMPYIVNNGRLVNTAEGRIETQLLATGNWLESYGEINGRVLQVDGTGRILGGTVTKGYVIDATHTNKAGMMVSGGAVIMAESGPALTVKYTSTVSFAIYDCEFRARQPEVVSGTDMGTVEGPTGGWYTVRA